MKTPLGRVTKYDGVFIGYVKNNEDTDKMGRLQVWIPEFNSDPDDPSGWKIVSYCSPFAGTTNFKDLSNEVGTFEGTQTSYGMWFVPPDLEAQVLVMFANSDPVKGFWMGCAIQQQMNHMMPAKAYSSRTHATSYMAGKKIPAAEYNKHTRENTSDSNVIRPIASPTAKGIGEQGLLADEVRGITTSSARRESPSQVYGISTPGPKNALPAKGRKGGHSFVMDDGEGSEYIGIKTRSGASIRID